VKKGLDSKKLEKALKIMAFEVLMSLKGSELARRFPKAPYAGCRGGAPAFTERRRK
jgi:hypothetical protein